MLLHQLTFLLSTIIVQLVDLKFEQNVYRVSEDVGSEDLALYACLTADNVDRPFTATITPVSGTATGMPKLNHIIR